MIGASAATLGSPESLRAHPLREPPSPARGSLLAVPKVNRRLRPKPPSAVAGSPSPLSLGGETGPSATLGGRPPGSQAPERP